MKDLEKEAKEFLREKGWTEKSTGCLDMLSKQLSEFATEAVNSALQEAAEKAEKDMFCAYLVGQTDYRNTSQGLKGRSFKSWYEENNIKNNIRSLQIKDK